MADLDELARRFRALGETSRPRAPLYGRLCATIADDPSIVELLTAAPEHQQLPVLLLAALHEQVLAAPDGELAGWYATAVADPRTDDVGAALRRHCRTHGEAIRCTVASRSTQTNEVGRCGILLPALGIVAEEMGAIALTDVGTSAGLNLFLDHFEYHYEPGGSVGGPSAVRFQIGTRGAVPVPSRLPRVTARIGIDREPIDVTDAAAIRWLRACVWPDQPDRFHRLEHALAIAALDPAEVRTADAVDGLSDAVATARRAGHPVVMNSWVLNYLPDERRDAYLTEIDRLGADGDLSWVFAESPAQAHGLPFPSNLEGAHVTALTLVRWRRGERRVDHLGVSHPHGYWLHWAA